MANKLSKADYMAHAEFRYALRRFLRFGEEITRKAQMTPQKYQTLLAVKGRPDRERITIGELAEQLQVRHHSAVEIVDRLEAQGLVRRQFGTADRRFVFIELTPVGAALLNKLVRAHREELRESWAELEQSVQHLRDKANPASGPRRATAESL